MCLKMHIFHFEMNKNSILSLFNQSIETFYFKKRNLKTFKLKVVFNFKMSLVSYKVNKLF